MILENLVRILFLPRRNPDGLAHTLSQPRSGPAHIPFQLRSTRGGLARILSRQQSTLVQELVPFRQSSILVLELALFLLFCGLVQNTPPRLLHAKRHQ